jgi:hypothetical protein
VSTVTLTVVGDEMEAEAICGLLRTNGIKCAHLRSNMAAGAATFGGGVGLSGPTEILVDESDLDTARELLKP